jgi:hypothetical protein
MSDPLPPSASSLQFEQVEPAAGGQATPSAMACGRCGTALPAEYFQVDGQTTCAVCKDARLALHSRKPSTEVLLRAGLYGGAAAVVGSIAWFAITKLTGLEIGLVAVVLGVFVGRAVRRGSEGLGGRVFQVMAVVLTYLAIVTSYVPAVLSGFANANQPGASSTTPKPGAPAGETPQPSTSSSVATTPPAAGAPSEAGAMHPLVAIAVLLGISFLIALAAPFLAGVSNILGILIIGFAVWEAWRVNRKVAPIVTGPFRVGGDGAAGA